MIYLGKDPIGILATLPEWIETYATIEFDTYQNFDTATTFFQDSNVSNIISTLINGYYKIIFNNNTANTRAGIWITFKKTSSGLTDILVMRKGMTAPQGYTYGVDVYAGASGIIYWNTKE